MRYFSRDEFVMGSVNVYDMMDLGFLDLLDELRHRCGFAISINSSYRTSDYNRSIGGSPRSQHLRGLAVDIQCTDPERRRRLVANALLLGMTVGIYKTFVHVDGREDPIIFVP